MQSTISLVQETLLFSMGHILHDVHWVFDATASHFAAGRSVSLRPELPPAWLPPAGFFSVKERAVSCLTYEKRKCQLLFEIRRLCS
jgi:hypothetical protein